MERKRKEKEIPLKRIICETKDSYPFPYKVTPAIWFLWKSTNPFGGGITPGNIRSKKKKMFLFITKKNIEIFAP